MTKSVSGFVCFFFLFMQMSQPFAQVTQVTPLFQPAPIASASTGDEIDLDPPQVDHIPVPSGVAGSQQSLSVKAVDVQGIASVTLLYRANPKEEYKKVLMRQVSGSENFTASIDSSIEQKSIEYYFLVKDTGGNTVLNGFPYQPFSRTLTPSPALSEDSTEISAEQSLKTPAPPIPVSPLTNPGAAEVTEISSIEDKSTKGKTLLWVLLGVLAVGAIASSSGSGPGNGANPSNETVPVIVNVPLPN